MAYTIIRSNGTVLTTIPDGNINTSSTSLALPGRNYPGYGQVIDTNFVRITENFANSSPPANPLKGQLWFNTGDNTLRICPNDGITNAASWNAVATTNATGLATAGNVTVSGDISANNAAIGNIVCTGNISAVNATLSNQLIVDTANVITGNITSIYTSSITAIGGNITFVGNLNVQSGSQVVGGNSKPTSIYTDNYYYANGQPFTPSGTYTNGNVADYLSGTNTNGTNPSLTKYSGNIFPNQVTTSKLGAGPSGGTIAGIWTLETGARINATYADLAERFEADTSYDVGTVVELGGDKEITAVQDECSEEVFGVVSKSAAFTLNGAAGDDETHPAIAMSGRVPVKVIGKVKKGQRLVSAGHGYARGAKRDEMTAFNVIGRALENKTTEGSGTVLAVVAITK